MAENKKYTHIVGNDTCKDSGGTVAIIIAFLQILKPIIFKRPPFHKKKRYLCTAENKSNE
jgi:hypothetical protein